MSEILYCVYKMNKNLKEMIVAENNCTPDKRVNIVTIKIVREATILYDTRKISSAGDAVELGKKFLEDADREQLLLYCLDTKNQPIEMNVVSVSSLNSSIVHPREVFKAAILSNAASVILFHNHPSGDPSPSNEDVNVAKRLKEAEKELQRILNELDGGTYIEETKLSVSSYLRNWLKTYGEPNLSPTSIDGYKSNIENYIIPNIGNIPLQKLSPIHLQEMYLKLSQKGRLYGKEGLLPRSIRYIHRNLSKALDESMKMQIIKKNVATLVTISNVKLYNAEIYDEDEVITLLNVVKDTDMEVPITLAVTLGLMRGELLGLKWCDINLIEGKMTINNNLVSTSNGVVLKTQKISTSCRTLELSDSIVKLLKKHQKSQKENKFKLGGEYKDNDLVCCYSDGSVIQPKNFSKKFAYFLRKNGLKHIRLYDLRHTNATLMLEYGVPAKVASQRLGHSSINITMDLYSHVTTNMQKEVAEKIENGIFNKLMATNL